MMFPTAFQLNIKDFPPPPLSHVRIQDGKCERRPFCNKRSTGSLNSLNVDCLWDWKLSLSFAEKGSYRSDQHSYKKRLDDMDTETTIEVLGDDLNWWTVLKSKTKTFRPRLERSSPLSSCQGQVSRLLWRKFPKLFSWAEWMTSKRPTSTSAPSGGIRRRLERGW